MSKKRKIREATGLGSAEATAASQPIAVDGQHERKAALAYSYWEARGCQGGSADEDWYRAETELASMRKEETAPPEGARRAAAGAIHSA